MSIKSGDAGCVKPLDPLDVMLRRTAKETREILRNYYPVSEPPTSARDSTHDGVLPQLTHDTILTGLAQLGAVRMKCRRSFVSLFSQTHQYVLAEGVNGGCIAPSMENKLLGNTTIEISDGLCPNTLGAFANELPPMVTENSYADRTRYVINDLIQEPVFRDNIFAQSNTDEFRFYCEVPLRSTSGNLLGTYCIIDGQPRSGASDADIQYLQEVGQAIMAYLNHIKINSRCNRANHLMKGVGLFVRGKSSLREWWLAQPDNFNKSGSLTANEKQQDLFDRADQVFGAIPQPDAPPSMSCHASHDSIVKSKDVRRKTGLTSSSTDSLDTPATSNSTIVDTVTSPSPLSALSPLPVASKGGSPDYFQAEPSQNGYNSASTVGTMQPTLGALTEASLRLNIDTNARNDSLLPHGDKLLSNVGFMDHDVHSIFSRASNLIREAVELCGAIFLEATPIASENSKATKYPREESSNESGMSSEDERRTSASRSASHTATNHDERRNAPCGILGYSTRMKSSLASNKVTNSTPKMSVNELQGFLHRYPHGTAFAFDSNGVISSSEEETQVDQALPRESDSIYKKDSNKSAKAKKRRRRDAELLSRILPGVRSAAFVSLWDFNKDRWYAGCLVWTTDSKRLLDEEDLAYFSVFGHSVMAELSRIELMTADNAKSDFISSISHELRSPLHGILGCAELLRETLNSPSQKELISMVEICGKTLLDTMNHLLDHAKINHLITDNKSTKESLPVQSPGQAVTSDRALPIDLANLAEEVVESVYAGHIHSSSSSSLFHMTGNGQEAWPNTETNSQGTSVDSSIRSATKASVRNTMIILCVDHCDQWVFLTDVGAWKRLLMNVFGNALKYTQSGSILVQLKTTMVPITGRVESRKYRLTLTVSDTGRGISSNYIQNHLFKPFRQENDLDVGAGLGLSIVSSIAKSLGATVNIQSDVGLGTKISITANLESSLPLPGAETRFQTRIDRARAFTSGKEVCLVGFDLLPAMSEDVGSELSTQSRQLIQLKIALENTLSQWLGMSITMSRSPEESLACIVVIHESYLSRWLQSEGKKCTEGYRQRQPWVILGLHSSVEEGSGLNLHYLQHPFTPSRIAHTVLSSLAPNLISSEPKVAEGKPHVDDISTTGEEDSTSGAKVDSIPVAAPNAQKIVLEGMAGTSPTLSDYETVNKPKMLSPPSQINYPRGISTFQEKAQAAGLALSVNPPTILVVDDNAINIRLLGGFLGKLKYKFSSATNGLEAIQRYTDSAPKHFAIIFMDLSMPIMDGFEATRRIRKVESAQNLKASKIIALSGLGSMEAKQKASACGVDLFLTKPAGYKQVKNVMTELDPANLLAVA